MQHQWPRLRRSSTTAERRATAYRPRHRHQPSYRSSPQPCHSYQPSYHPPPLSVCSRKQQQPPPPRLRYQLRSPKRHDRHDRHDRCAAMHHQWPRLRHSPNTAGLPLTTATCSANAHRPCHRHRPSHRSTTLPSPYCQPSLRSPLLSVCRRRQIQPLLPRLRYQQRSPERQRAQLRLRYQPYSSSRQLRLRHQLRFP